MAFMAAAAVGTSQGHTDVKGASIITTLIGGLVRHEAEATALSLLVTHNTGARENELTQVRGSSSSLPDNLSELQAMR